MKFSRVCRCGRDTSTETRDELAVCATCDTRNARVVKGWAAELVDVDVGLAWTLARLGGIDTRLVR